MNNITLAIKVTDFDFEHDYISSLFKLKPINAYKKGENFYIGPPGNQTLKQYETNYWDYRINIKSNSVWIKEVIDRFLEEVFYQNENAFKSLYEKCEIEFYIGVQFYEVVDSYHFDRKSLRFLSTYNIEIDIDQSLVSNFIIS